MFISDLVDCVQTILLTIVAIIFMTDKKTFFLSAI